MPVPAQRIRHLIPYMSLTFKSVAELGDSALSDVVQHWSVSARLDIDEVGHGDGLD